MLKDEDMLDINMFCLFVDLKEKQSVISGMCVSLSLERKQSKQCMCAIGRAERAGKKKKTSEIQ